MTLLWVLIGLISLIVCAVIFRTLVRQKNVAPLARAEFDVTVYKDQLLELDRDMQRGILNADETTAARTEIERRILTLADDAEATTKQVEELKPGAQSAQRTPALLCMQVSAPVVALTAQLLRVGQT